MEEDLKALLGRILGEMYRIQYRIDPEMCPVEDEATIFGLVSGIESVINNHIPTLVSSDAEYVIGNALNKFMDNPNEFSGYYQIEDEIKQQDGTRHEAITLFKYYRARNAYVDLIDRMDSDNSPDELRGPFEIRPTEGFPVTDPEDE